MAKGILGKKVGMTQIFSETGTLIPVTVIEVTPNVVLQKKTVETDGYNAVQLGYADKREKLANKPETGHAAKANTAPKRFVKEIAGEEMLAFEVGQEVKGNIFTQGELVDVTGTSKGKGYQGVVKRHGFGGVGEATHGQDDRQRAPGSIGACSTPSRVFKGMRMGGHMGCNRVKVENLEVLKVMPEKNVVLVKGAVPGAKGGYLIMTK